MKNVRTPSRSLLAATFVAGLAFAAADAGPADERRPVSPPEPPAPPAALAIQELLGPGAGARFRGAPRAWIGVRVEEVDGSDPTGAAESHGARVSGIEEDSPAGRAGLKVNDVIVSYQGQRVEGAAALLRMVRETPAGRTVRLGVRRAGALRNLSVTLEERQSGPRAGRPDLESLQAPGEDADLMFEHPRLRSAHPLFMEGPRLGIEAEALGDQLARHFGVGDRGGVLVKAVHEGTPAARAGLRAGDVIVRAGKAEVADVDELREALSEAPDGKITLTIVRDRAETSLNAEVEAPEHEDQPRRPRPPGRPRLLPPPESEADRL